ncbi:MAG: hypothetical protein J0H39_10755 [Alphaproteobacteria bacterium]|nr:hypothetical protein [Alphaproteobacteria bacterium]
MIELRFASQGEAYESAKETADALGLSVKDYLILCIAEGHKTLTTRALLESGELIFPTFERRGSLAYTANNFANVSSAQIKSGPQQSALILETDGGVAAVSSELQIPAAHGRSELKVSRDSRMRRVFRYLWKALK